MSKKISAEEAALRGELLGESYTPPGRTAVFDIPSYDDIADLHELFKRFANTCAAYSEAGGGAWVDKTSAFTVEKADLTKTFLCTWATAQSVTMPAVTGFAEGDRVTLIQGGAGKVQVAGPVVGTLSTGGQYEGLTVTLHDGKWWCVPFGASGGGGGGPVPITKLTADYTVAAKDMGSLLAVDTASGNHKITIPADDGTIPLGSVFVVANVGVAPSAVVTLVGAAGVILQDRANVNIARYKSVSLVKRDTNTWLLNAGGGEGSGGAPGAPTDAQAFGGAGSLIVSWKAPADDGGHTITSYLIEYGTDQAKLDKKFLADSDQTSAVVPNLTAGTKYYAWVKAMNSVGASDPSSIVSGTPTNDYNDAEGGNSVTTYMLGGKMYRLHVFTSDSDFTVVKAVNPFRVLAVGGGSGGGTGQPYCKVGDHGASGQAVESVVILPKGATAVKVGGVAGTSSLSTVVAKGAQNTGRITSDITGVSASYPAADGGDGPCGSDGSQRGGDGTRPGGAGGGGGGIGNSSPFQPGAGGAGAPGTVYVSYEIAPYNDASGGVTAEIDNYNGTGQKWRTHTFKANDDFVVKHADKPFRVLVVAGGGGGAGRAGNNAQGAGGGNGGAGGAREWRNASFTAGSFPVQVGQGGGGADGGGQPCRGGQGGASSVSVYATTGGGGGGIGTEGGSGGSGGGGGCAIGNWNGPWGGGAGIAGEGNNGAGGSGSNDGSHASGGAINLQTDITGANRQYSTGDYGNPGSGGNWNTGGTSGGPGVVVIAYQIG